MTTDLLTSPAPSVTRDDLADPRGVVLVLHGGKPASSQVVDGRSASWRRMAAMQRSLGPDLREAGVASWLLRYRRRGWNGGAPVTDAQWALREVRRELGDVPVVLLGHSMGARTAVHVADDPSVVGVVGLAPWWQESDPVGPLRGRRLVAAHGRVDRITSPRATQAYLQRADGVAASVELRDMGRVGHYMLRRAADWNAVATEAVLRQLG